MKPETIIRKKISDDGLGLSLKILADLAIEKINSGKVFVFHYDKVVLTVDKEGPTPEVHLYSMEPDIKARSIGKRFIRDMWRVTPHKYIFARTKDKKVVELAKIFGFNLIGKDLNNYSVYMIERSIP